MLTDLPAFLVRWLGHDRAHWLAERLGLDAVLRLFCERCPDSDIF